MKIFLLFAFLCCSGVAGTHAQTPFTTCDSVNVNNINARILVHGDMFGDPVLGLPACEFPQGSGKHINFASSLWMAGYDNSGKLHVATQTYRQNGNDYWPGPIDVTGMLAYSMSQNWAKIWKVNNSDIQYFLGLTTHTAANTPPAILTWPGRQSSFAQGNAGVSLTIDHDMAPFVDLNGNGIYEPLLGDYPDIKGDQALWWVFNDNGPAHSSSNGKPLGVEVHGMAYAYSRGTLIDNVVYLDFTVVNRSPNSYSNMRIGLWDDIDLGWYYDDFTGFDSSRRMGIQYNGTTYDGSWGASSPDMYGADIPMAGITMIEMPGDAGTSYAPAGSFIFYDNDASVIGNPVTDTQYNYYLHAKTLAGQSYANGFSGYPQCELHDSNRYYCYSGDLADTAQCSECALHNTPGDRRFIITTNDFVLPTGSGTHLLAALVATNPGTNNACGSATFDGIRVVADTAWSDYQNPPSPSITKNVVQQDAVNIYPNPAHDKLYVENTSAATGLEWTSVYNAIGQKMSVSITKTATQAAIDLSQLPPGLYHIVCANGAAQKSATFIKD